MVQTDNEPFWESSVIILKADHIGGIVCQRYCMQTTNQPQTIITIFVWKVIQIDWKQGYRAEVMERNGSD